MNNKVKIKVLCIGLIIISLLIKVSLFKYQYIDFTLYLEKWIAYMQQNGYSSSLKDAFHNYTLSYIYILLFIAKLDLPSLYNLYAIKAISVCFEFIAALYIGKLVYMVRKDKIVIWLSLAIIPLLPTVILNSSYQSQCDSIYATFAIASIYYVLNDKRILAMVLLGIAISFKIQTVMIFPFYFLYLLRGNIKWYYFAIVPCIYVLSMIPAWIAGRPILDLLTIYGSQSEYNSGLVSNFANIYVITGEIFNSEKIYGMIFVALLTIIAGIILSNKKYIFDNKTWFKFIFLSTIICPFFLPGMLERYMYLGDLFAILFILTFRKKIYLPIGIIFISFYSYIRCLHIFSTTEELRNVFSFFEFIPWKIIAVFFAFIILMATIDFNNTLKINSPEAIK